MLIGQGGMVLLGGEPGVGKTRLARELHGGGARARLRGLTGQCYEQEGAPPFGPFVEIDGAGRAAGAAGRAGRARRLAPEMAAMAPSLRRTFRDIPPLPDVPPSSSGG